MPKSCVPNPEFLRMAIDLAVKNIAEAGGPFGVVIAREGCVIATGANRVTSTNDPTAHAEIVAIRAACQALESFQLTGCEIYSSCEPCPMCLAAIYWSRASAVYYAAAHEDAAAAGFDDSLIYSEIRLKPIDRRLPMVRIPMDDYAAPFQAWMRKADKIRY